MPQRAKADRPLSPHLQVYRLPLLAILSILHRITGVGLAIGLLMLTWFLTALAMGPSAFDCFARFAGSPLGVLMLMGWAAAWAFHFCSGIRHLFLDTGSLFDLRSAYVAGYAILAGAVIIALLLLVRGF